MFKRLNKLLSFNLINQRKYVYFFPKTDKTRKLFDSYSADSISIFPKSNKVRATVMLTYKCLKNGSDYKILQPLVFYWC